MAFDLGGIEMSNQGHWVFIGMCIIDNVLLDSGAVRPRGLLFNSAIQNIHNITFYILYLRIHKKSNTMTNNAIRDG